MPSNQTLGAWQCRDRLSGTAPALNRTHPHPLPADALDRYPLMRLLPRLALSLAVALAASGAVASAQEVEFSTSDLPIILLETEADIPDDPKIAARMRIIDNGPGARNAVTDVANDYDGWAGIEIRGSSSQAFPKLQYGIETRDADGEDVEASLLGMPEEEDWVLYAPYVDKSLMRNVLAYHLARRAGRYASRTRFCEVVLNGEYQGLYVLMEKVKRGDGRVDVNKLKDDETEGDDLTGGYIVKIDATTGDDEDDDLGWRSPYGVGVTTGRPPIYLFDVPDADDVAPEQAAYIQAFVTGFEAVMADGDFEDPEAGYDAYINAGSFVDFLLLTELSKDHDGYRRSAFFHKDKDSNDPLLHAGPVWDFNLAFGNADRLGTDDPEGWRYEIPISATRYPIPFWWGRLARSERFGAAILERWTELRRGPFHPDSLDHWVDSTAGVLDEAQARNFERWPVLGERLWLNAYVGETYGDEVGYLKRWLRERGAWMDGALGGATPTEPSPAGGFSLSAPRPNPARGAAWVVLEPGAARQATVEVFDIRGRLVARVWQGPLTASTTLTIDTATLPAGVYLVRATSSVGTAAARLAVVR